MIISSAARRYRRLGPLSLGLEREVGSLKRIDGGMVLDFNEAGDLIGIELFTPWRVTLEAIDNVLAEHGLELLKESDLKPLLAA